MWNKSLHQEFFMSAEERKAEDKRMFDIFDIK
jgi:hypothetical protein